MNENYFEENSKWGSQTNNSKKAVSIPTLIISIITTIVLVIIIVAKWDSIMEVFGVQKTGSEISALNALQVWDQVSLSWNFFDGWDIVNYTHILDSDEYWEIWIRSQNINLNNYNDEVYLEWIVEKTYQWIPIVSVDTIYSLDMEEELTGDVEDEIEESETKYLSNVWLYFDEDFFQNYSLVNEWNDWILKIKDIKTNEIISLDYFKCSESVVSQNCDRFNEMFATSSSQKFVDKDGISYYKQAEVQSWFFSNDSFFGYFANDVEDSTFKNLVKYLTVINQKFVEKNVLEKVDLVCWDDGKAMKNVDNYELKVKDKEFYLFIEWDDWSESSLSCEVKINPSLKNNAKMVDLEVLWDIEEDNEKEDEDEDEETEDNQDNEESENIEIVENYDRDSDVEQFEINLEKTLEFTSRRGHTIVFPSSNIAYAGKSIQEDFSIAWVNCFSVMNVVEYSQKELVDQKWSVKVYECTTKDGFDDSSQNLIYKKVWDQEFIIEIVDPSWVKFGNNITIK